MQHAQEELLCFMYSIDFKHFMKPPDEAQDQIVEADESLPELVEEMKGGDVYDKLRIFSNLTQFQVKVFKGEPKLVSAILHACMCMNYVLACSQPLAM